MSEPAPEGPPAMETPQEEVQPIPASANQTNESDLRPSNELDIPKRSPFATKPTVSEKVEPEVARQEEKPLLERPATPTEQPRPDTENIEPTKPPSRSQQGQSELEQPPIGQTTFPGLPSVRSGSEAPGLARSELLIQIYAGRQILRRELAKITGRKRNVDQGLTNKG